MAAPIDQAKNYYDLKGLNDIRLQSKSANSDDKQQALQRVAKQFEGLFMQMLLKSMRQAEDVLADDGVFNSQTTRFYRDMYDQQLAIEMSDNGSLGLAPLIVQQLGGDTEHFTPKSAIHTDGVNLPKLREKQTNDFDLDTYNRRFLGLAEKTDNSTETVNNPQPQFSSPQDFVQALIEPAKQVESSLGIPYQVVIAQSALETGWGKKIIQQNNGTSSNNLFNIKADASWQGQKVHKQTLEFENGSMVKKSEPFRVYDSIKQSVADYIDFLGNSERYKPALEHNGNVEQFLQGLSKAGYATDPNYASKVLSVLGRLSQYIQGE